MQVRYAGAHEEAVYCAGMPHLHCRALMHPYRTSTQVSGGRRWGATWLVRLLTWNERRKRNNLHEARQERLREIARCQHLYYVDAGFLYFPLKCTCGEHTEDVERRNNKWYGS